MPVNWDDFEAVQDEPAVDWSEFEPATDFRRDELKKQTFEARIEGERAKALSGLADVGTEAAKAIVRAASHVDPTGFTQGLMQQYGVEPTHVIPPEAAYRGAEIASEAAGVGLRKLGITHDIIPKQVQKPIREFAAENIAALPEMIPLLAAGTVAPKTVGRVFQSQMLQGVPQAAYQAATAATPEERLKAGLGAGLGIALPAAIEMGLREPSVRVPDFIGRQIEIQRGATPPRGEPVAPIERVTPEQSALAAERMSREFEGKTEAELAHGKETRENIEFIDKKGRNLTLDVNTYSPSSPRIRVLDNDGKEIGKADLYWNQSKHSWSVIDIEIDPEFRRAGVATKIYNTYEDLGFKLQPSEGIEAAYLSEEGKAFWTARNKKASTEQPIVEGVSAGGEPSILAPEKTEVPKFEETTPLDVKPKELVLWGFKPGTSDMPVKLSKSSRKSRERDGWILAEYAKGDEPTGLILQAKEAQPKFETITPKEDAFIGKNEAGEELYKRRENGQVYRMRNDRPKDRPNGYPDFGGDLAVKEQVAVPPEPPPAKAEVATTVDKPIAKLSNKTVSTIWNKLVETSRDDLTELLVNWQDARLSEDGTKIIGTVGRDKTDKVSVSKKSFIEWLHGDEPLNPKVYDQNPEWTGLVNRTRETTGLQPKPTPPPEVAKVAEGAKGAAAKPAVTQPIIGMGGATPSELTGKPPMQSAIKNAAVDRDRVERGEPPMMDALRKGDPELWSQAMNVVDQDWTAADKLIARHKANPFIPSDVETMVLLHRRVDLKNEFNKANREATLAEQEGRGDAAEAAKAVRDSMGEKLLELEQVMGKGDTAMGTMAGRAFRARQLVMNEDFTMAELVPNREAALGRKLTDPERAQLQAISDANAKANAELQARVEKLQAERDSIDAKRIIAESEARIKRDMPYHPRILDLAESYAKKWDERGAQALADLKALFGGGDKPMFSGAPISPEMLDKAIIYGTSKMVRGAVDFAKWSDTMIRDLGPGFKDHAKAVWEASQKAFNSDVAEAFKKQGMATVQKVKGALKADLGTETILKKIQRKVEESKGVLPDLKYYFDKLLDFHVRRGLKEEGPLLDAIHADAIKVIPDLTRRETREILAGYGTPLKPLAKDTVSVIKRDMHGQWQEISKIDMIQRGIFPPKLQERATMTDKQRWLRKQYEEQKRLHPEVTPTDVEGQLKTALQAAKTRITNQITDLEHQIQTRTKIVRESKRLKPDAELERLTAIRDEMRAVYETVFKKPELTDAERLEIWKERTRDRIEELTEKVRTKQFQPRKKPDPVKMDKEAQRLRFELHKVHRALLDLRYNDQMSKRNAAAKAFDAVANTVWFQRAMMTTGEFSGVLRQGGALSYQNPTIALRNLKPMMEAFKSEQNQFRIMEEILTRDNAPLYEKYGLEFTEAGTRLSSMEEHFMFRLSENMQKQPGLKQLVGTVNKFQRAYTVFLNRMRADVFDAMADTWGKDPATLEQISNAINVFSGRGSKGVGKFLGSGQFANTIAFAPKYAISRIQMLALQPMWRGNLQTRKMIAWQYLKMLRGPAALYALGSLMGGKVNTDSNSSDFGKMVVGKTRIDPWMGILQPLVLFSRLGTGKKTTAGGREVPIRGKVPYGGDNAWDVIANFGRGKLSPSVGSAVSVLSGEDPTGQPFDIGDALKTTFYPMTYRDIIKLYGEHGIPEATAMATLGVFGVGVNTYDDRKKKTSQPNW